jgi:hypothetical protein
MPLRTIDRPSNRAEVLIGRSMAVCVHPLAAWRSPFRALLLMGYFAAAYIATFAVLVLL